MQFNELMAYFVAIKKGQFNRYAVIGVPGTSMLQYFNRYAVTSSRNITIYLFCIRHARFKL